MEVNKFIDHTLLKADAKKSEIVTLCNEAIEYDFMSVCVNPNFVKLCSESLEKSDVKVCTVIGFPLGQNTEEVKVFEAKDAISNGAEELDMVINISDLKDGNDDKIIQEIKKIKSIAGDRILKVILETCLLSDKEIIKASQLSVEAGADFVKTSTGFSTGGATVEDVKLMKDTVGSNAEVKASGGVRTFEDFKKMVKAGATRIGASAGINIIESSKK